MRHERARASTPLFSTALAVSGADYTTRDLPSRAGPCSGHGTLDPWSHKCTCDNPFPAVGQTGWTGDLYQAETVNIATQTVASHETQSGHLPGGAWRCFVTVHAAGRRVALPRRGAQAHVPRGRSRPVRALRQRHPPDVPERHHEEGTISRGSPARPRTRDGHRSERGTPPRRHGGVPVHRGVRGPQHHVRASGRRSSECPTRRLRPAPGPASRGRRGSSPVFIAHGRLRSPRAPCDDPRAGARAASTTTTYLPPDGDDGSEGDAVPTESLRFESCSARVDFARDDDASRMWTNQSLAPGAWHFYAFTSREDDCQTVVTLTRGETSGAEPHAGGRASAYLRPRGSFPIIDGTRPSDVVRRPPTTRRRMILTRGDTLPPGDVVRRRVRRDGNSARYDLSVQKYDCRKRCAVAGSAFAKQTGRGRARATWDPPSRTSWRIAPRIHGVGEGRGGVRRQRHLRSSEYGARVAELGRRATSTAHRGAGAGGRPRRSAITTRPSGRRSSSRTATPGTISPRWITTRSR